ncbi:hypothetical protein Tco_0860331 [Tanacetum coccineum]|uniref:Uncharacterized protein n=1 Tax=Tanacetum coccineum TaxID=301880 RepID=A0ABQ5BIN7_9ASTR
MANKKNMSVINEGLKLIHTDNDVHSFFADAESNGKIHLYIAHKKQELGRCSLEEGLTIVEGDGDMNKMYDMAENIADEVELHDDKKYEGLSVDGYIDVVGSSKCCDLVHESVGYNGHSLPNMDKECFSNDVVSDVVVPDTLAYTLSLVLKKYRSKVSVTRKRSWLNSSKITSLRKGSGKRVGCEAKNQR